MAKKFALITLMLLWHWNLGMAETVNYIEYITGTNYGPGTKMDFKYTHPDIPLKFSVTIEKLTDGPHIGLYKIGEWVDYHQTGNEISWYIYDIVDCRVFLHATESITIEPPADSLPYDTDCWGECTTLPPQYDFNWFLRKIPSLTVAAGTFEDILINFSVDERYPPNSANALFNISVDELPHAITHVRWFARGLGMIKDMDILSETGEILHTFEMESWTPAYHFCSGRTSLPQVPLILLNE